MKALLLLVTILAAQVAHGETIDCSTNRSGEKNFFKAISKGDGKYSLDFFVVNGGETSDSGAL